MDERKRKRGIKACRHKLEKCMLQKGFGSQSALAQHIAQIESLSKPPYNLVNKVFREQPVSLKNLLRIAAGLGVELHEIIINTNEQTLDELQQSQSETHDENTELDSSISNTAQQDTKASASDHSEPKKSRTLYSALAAIFFISVLAMVVIFLFDEHAPLSANEKPMHTTLRVDPITPVLGKVRVKVLSQELPLELRKAIQNSLNELDNVNFVFSTTSADFSLSTSAMYEKWPVQLILRLNMTKGSVFDLMQIQWIGENRSVFIAYELAHPKWLDFEANAVGDRLKQKISTLLEHSELPATMVSNRALLLTQQAKDRLFFSASQTEYEEAELIFRQALQISPNLAQAHAGLCDTLVKSQWFDDELSTWIEAENHCDEAIEQAPDSIDAKLALAQLYSFTGREAQAYELIAPLYDKDGGHYEIALLLANILSKLGEQSQTAAAFDTPINLALASIEFEPRYWRAYNFIGQQYFSTGNVAGAQNYFAASYKINPQEIIGANLGVMQICLAQLEQAERTLLSVIDRFDNKYFAFENLATMHYLNQEYQAALDNMLTSISLQPDLRVHQVWAQLASIYEKLDNSALATENFEKALQYLQEDMLRESRKASLELFEFYYQFKLDTLANREIDIDRTKAQLKAFTERSDAHGTQEKRRLIEMAQSIGAHETSERVREELVELCPVYGLEQRF
ncbi:tetratricopeptide repeat protein [Ningiella sp. W23]|uniref:tetratricopeptide repeat protein n=1 Tax=Ningiella sp. W23 TaxID=3023715 RepID=UPI00375656B9